jgi:uncharacterized membrane protein
MNETQASPLPRIGKLTLSELLLSLKAGWFDFRAAPIFGIFFASIYVLAGLILLQFQAGTVSWTLAMSLGFPLVAPFLAVGLYEVSRRIEAGQSLEWGAILGVVWQERTRQIPWLGAIIVIYFLFWTFLAHMIFALFMGPSALVNASTSWDIYLTGPGRMMVLTEFVVGAVVAFLLFSLTVVSLPMLLELEVDFVTAMLHSLATVRENLFVMLVWAGLIAILTMIAMVPYFLGLLVVLPILAHASWHLYRRALYQEVVD